MPVASERAPIEIWDLILNLVIEVQGLNTLQIGMPSCSSGDASYWRSENQRKTLRLVFRNWNELMTKRKHRLVQFSHYCGRKISKKPIGRAKHLIVNSLEIVTSCWGAPYYGWRFAIPAGLGSPIDVFTREARRAGRLQVESLHLGLPRLTVLVIDSKLSPCTALSISEIFPNLISLSLIMKGCQPESPATATQPQPEFLKLEFLSIIGRTNNISKLHFKTWKLPSLRILQFYRITLNVERVEQLDQIFPQDCRGVKVLSLGLINNLLFIDHKFWEFFPNIHTFYPDLFHIWITEPPPTSHPFFSLVFSPTEKKGDAEGSLHALIDFVGLCQGIQVVRLAITWDIFCHRSSYEVSDYPWWPKMFEECQNMSKRLLIEDGDGIPYKPEHGDMFAKNEALITKDPEHLPRKYTRRCGWVSCKSLLAPVVGNEGILLGM